jgi:hypothetical protein
MSDESRNADVTGPARDSMPVSECRRFLKKLTPAGVVIPSAILLVDGTRNVAFAC